MAPHDTERRAFAKLAAQYQQQPGLLDGTARKKGVTSECTALAKSTACTALIACLVKAANALYLLYKAEEPANLTEAARMHRRASDYTAISDQALATEATGLAQRVTATKTQLMSDYNMTAASLKDLTDDARSFDTQLTAPKLAIDAAKIKGPSPPSSAPSTPS